VEFAMLQLYCLRKPTGLTISAKHAPAVIFQNRFQPPSGRRPACLRSLLSGIFALVFSCLLGAVSASSHLNCTLDRCFNAENICGRYVQPCIVVAKTPELEVLLSVEFEFRADHVFRRIERGAFTRAACERGDFWLEVEYEGRWHHQGGSLVWAGSSLAHTDVTSVWLELLQDRVCLPQANGKERCMDPRASLQVLCPCNNWDWESAAVPARRNVGMFCGPRSQCPLLHDAYIRKRQYFSYNATVNDFCYSASSVETLRGWESPTLSSCVRKRETMNCIAGVLSAALSLGGVGVLVSAIIVGMHVMLLS